MALKLAVSVCQVFLEGENVFGLGCLRFHILDITFIFEVKIV